MKMKIQKIKIMTKMIEFQKPSKQKTIYKSEMKNAQIALEKAPKII